MPRRFGASAQTMCDGCADVLARWRKLTREQRGDRIPFGRLIDNVYVLADEGLA